MSTRDDLADLIDGVGEYIPGSHAHDYISPNKAADAILAAGWRPPARVITTREELDALPHDSIIVDDATIGYQRLQRGWFMAGDEDSTYPILPATVLWEGDA